MRVLVFLLALLAALPVMAQDLVLRVRATGVRVTDLCSNCTPANLHEAYWTVYEAKVRGVVGGSFDEKTVRFAYAQHAQFTPRALKNFVVTLRPAPEWLRIQMGVDYEAVDVKLSGPGA
jgi:hypothetical protein